MDPVIQLTPFGQENIDHISSEDLLKIVNTMKMYELQDVAERIWFNRHVPHNQNIKLHDIYRSQPYNNNVPLQLWLGDSWKERHVDEVIHRMIEGMVEKIVVRLDGMNSVPDAQLKWLNSIPNVKGREYTFLCKGILRVIYRAWFKY